MKQFSLYSIFQSGMVLQRQKPIIIWGTAPAHSLITVQLSDTIASTNTAADGDWQCILPPTEAGEGHTLTVSCNDSDISPIMLEDISIGDVWLACGQSNMEFFLRYEEDWDNIKQYPKNPKIHMYNVPQLAFEGQKKDTTGWGSWITEGDEGFETFSAPGYSFARHLQPQLDIPIGIIGCNWGGTTASAWLDESYLQQAPLDIYLKEYEAALSIYSPAELERISMEGWEFETSAKHTEDFIPLMYGREFDWQLQYMKEHENDPVIPLGPWSINRPGGLYHQMLEPIIPFSIKGVLWYQGESDACHAEIYDKLLTSLITCWRKKWKDDFPFLFVQLAPFGKWLQCDSTGYCKTRAKQELVSKTVPNTGMVSIMDIGSYYDIHPKKKMEVGRRLALLARGTVYGENLLCQSPEFIGAIRDNTCITLSFNYCGHFSTKESDTIQGFHLTQNEKDVEIYKIEAKGNRIILQADILPQIPCTISLAWADYAVVNLVNEAGLPIKPFIATI